MTFSLYGIHQFVFLMKCVLCAVRSVSLHIMYMNLVSKVCIGSGAQSHVSHQEGQGSIPEHCVKFVVDNVALGQVSPPSTLFFPRQQPSTSAPYSSSSTLCSYHKDNRSKPGTLQNLCSSAYRGGLDEKLLSIFSLQMVNLNFSLRHTDCGSSSRIKSVRYMEPP